MNSILDRYGIKEVADLTFYEIQSDGTPGAPVLYIDTAKVSTIEQTAENTSARGGKGNPELIMWDYGKEITLNIEDALYSPKSMAIMFGALDADGNVAFNDNVTIRKTIKKGDLTYEGSNWKTVINGSTITLTGIPKFYKDTNTVALITDLNYTTEDWAYAVVEFTPSSAKEIVVSPNTFPGTYYITGDTYARNEVTGKDEFFQFVIPKAKMQSEVTLTMEAEGDPTTFTMNMKVLRPSSGQMMKLIQYSIDGGTLEINTNNYVVSFEPVVNQVNLDIAPVTISGMDSPNLQAAIDAIKDVSTTGFTWFTDETGSLEYKVSTPKTEPLSSRTYYYKDVSQ